jgi:hypothetical protein
MSKVSRREALVRLVQAGGVLVLAGRSTWARAGEGAADPAGMIDRAVGFLRPRQAGDGSWSADRKEPGITALVVTGLLRSGRVAAGEPAVTKGLAYLEQFLGPKGGLSEAPTRSTRPPSPSWPTLKPRSPRRRFKASSPYRAKLGLGKPVCSRKCQREISREEAA